MATPPPRDLVNEIVEPAFHFACRGEVHKAIQYLWTLDHTLSEYCRRATEAEQQSWADAADFVGAALVRTRLEVIVADASDPRHRLMRLLRVRPVPKTTDIDARHSSENGTCLALSVRNFDAAARTLLSRLLVGTTGWAEYSHRETGELLDLHKELRDQMDSIVGEARLAGVKIQTLTPPTAPILQWIRTVAIRSFVSPPGLTAIGTSALNSLGE